MRKKIISVVLIIVLINVIYISYRLIEFNEYRYTVIKNTSDNPFARNPKMVHIYPNLQRVGLSSSDLKKIEGLDSLTDLKSLLVYNSPKVTKIEGLDNLHNLEELTLENNSIEKIEGLSGLNHIRRIILDENYITTIENIEQVPLMKNDYCYIVPISKKEYRENIYSDKSSDFSSEDGYTAEECFLEAEPEVYIDKYLYDENYEYGEMVSPLSKGYISLGNNPVKYITQESYDYIKKYNIYVKMRQQYYKEDGEIIFFDEYGDTTYVSIDDLEII